MVFSIFAVVLITVAIDIWLTVRLKNRGRYAVAAFATIPLDVLMAYLWALILGGTVAAFSGQGAIGLTAILGLGLIFSVLRAVGGLILFIDFRRR